MKIFLNGLARVYRMQTSKCVTNQKKIPLVRSKQIYNADKFEQFELLKERFQLHQWSMMRAAIETMYGIQPSTHGNCTTIGSTEFKFNNCLCSNCMHSANIESFLAKTKELSDIEHDIKEIIDYFRDTRKNIENKEVKLKIAQEWKLLALVLDRTFFIVFFIITLGTLIVFFNIRKFE
jgi:hypothetical protein